MILTWLINGKIYYQLRLFHTFILGGARILQLGFQLLKQLIYIIRKRGLGSQRPVNLRMKFWCLQMSQKANKVFRKISNLASKMGQIKKIETH